MCREKELVPKKDKCLLEFAHGAFMKSYILKYMKINTYYFWSCEYSKCFICLNFY